MKKWQKPPRGENGSHPQPRLNSNDFDPDRQQIGIKRGFQGQQFATPGPCFLGQRLGAAAGGGVGEEDGLAKGQDVVIAGFCGGGGGAALGGGKR